jgi:hypothetical protein
VIAAAIGLFEFADLRRIFRIQRWEFWLSIGCFAGVAVLGVIPASAWRSRRGDRIPVGRLAAALRRARAGRRHPRYHDVKRYPDARLVPGWCCSAGTRRCSSPTRSCSPARARSRCELAAPVRRIVVPPSRSPAST